MERFNLHLLRARSVRAWCCVLLAAALVLGASDAYARHRTSWALNISGTPPSSVTVGQTFSFTPTVTASRGRALAFAVANRPAWATFSSTNGQLTGAPAASSVGSYADVVISVSDGTSTATLPAFTVQVVAAVAPPAPPPPTPAPVLSGTPPATVVAGSSYAFQPIATDPSGKSLSFSVQNKPAWAGFSIASGQLYGTPSTAQTGTYANIVISASDGTAAAALPAFSISVLSPPSTTGTALLTLTPPSLNTDGSALTDLAGMRVYYGTSASSLNQIVDIPGTAQTTYTLSNLASGNWYFVATAYTSDGQESAPSALANKSIP